MNDMYFLKISELPVINSRSQKEFDDVLLEYIFKFKKITNNEDTIAHLIATSIDYPVDYIKEMINSYKRSHVLSDNLEPLLRKDSFIREKLYVKRQNTLYFVYDRKNNNLKQLETIKIKEYENKIEKKVILDSKDYLSVYTQLFYCEDLKLNEVDKYLMSLTVKKIDQQDYKEFFKDRIEFYSLINLNEKQVKEIETPSNNIYWKILNRYKQNYGFLNAIRNGKGYYQYNLGDGSKNDSLSCDQVIEELLSIAKESVFIMTTKIGNKNNVETRAFKKFNELKSEGNHYIRTIEGFQDDDRMDVIVDQDKGYYSQWLSKKSHSKIIVVDNFFVALGSGNWFSNSRDNFEDSLVIFPYNNAIKAYCPIYYPQGDYYKMFEDLINKKNDLKDLLALYLTMKKDLLFDMNKSKNVYDEVLIKKIEVCMENNIKTHFQVIEQFLRREVVNREEFYYYLSSSNKLSDDDKAKLKRIYFNEGDSE